MTGRKVFLAAALGALMMGALASSALATHPRPGSGTPLRVGFIKLTVYCTDAQVPPCNPADGTDTEDVGIVVHLSDVVCRRAVPGCSAVGADYAGLFWAETPMRLTDHANGSPTGQVCSDGAGAPPCVVATTINTTFGFVRGQCVDNGGPGGGICSASTTIDAGIPGTVKEGQRSVLDTMGFTMYDGGTNGTIGPACPPICGEGHDGLMFTQGVFLP
jgi:hypothetical protein